MDIEGFGALEALDAGGSSSVFKADDLRHNRTVAIKVLDVDELDSTTARRFERECRTMGRISNHPNIVGVLDSGVSGGRPYIVMEYFDGGTLADRIAAGSLPLAEALKTGVEIASALATAHASDIAHRDVKPENIFISLYGDRALGDFGISAFTDADAVRTSHVSFTPAYAAPEIIDASTDGDSPEAGRGVDIYSLGVTLYSALTGGPPFVADSLTSLMAKILRDPIPTISRADVPQSLKSLLASMMARDPLNRPASAAHVGEQLRAIEVEMGFAATPLRIQVLGEEVAGAEGSGPDIPAAPLGDDAVVGGGIAAKIDLRGEDWPAPSLGEDEMSSTIARPSTTGEAMSPLEELLADSLHEDISHERRLAKPTTKRAVQLLPIVGGAIVVALIGYLLSVGLATDDGDDENDAELDLSSTTLPQLLATPAAPSQVEIFTSDGVVSIGWDHDGGDDVSFEVRDAGGNLVARDLKATEFQFEQTPPFGACFWVAAVRDAGDSSPISRGIETCR